jgi:hypothetical protein
MNSMGAGASEEPKLELLMMNQMVLMVDGEF